MYVACQPITNSSNGVGITCNDSSTVMKVTGAGFECNDGYYLNKTLSAGESDSCDGMCSVLPRAPIYIHAYIHTNIWEKPRTFLGSVAFYGGNTIKCSYFLYVNIFHCIACATIPNGVGEITCTNLTNSNATDKFDLINNTLWAPHK